MILSLYPEPRGNRRSASPATSPAGDDSGLAPPELCMPSVSLPLVPGPIPPQRWGGSPPLMGASLIPPPGRGPPPDVSEG